MPTATRPAAVAGTFYPLDARNLSADVEAHLDAAGRGGCARAPKMVLVPHAGYVYSGSVAAQAYAELVSSRGKVTRVVLLGPTHRVAVRGLVAPGVAAFETPLGPVRIDQESLARLAGLPQVGTSKAAHAEEHSLEVQLPFLQTVLGDFSLVPLAVGQASANDVAQVIERLWGDDETLIVISSDLSHYLPYAQAQAVDRATVERILQLDGRLDHEQACGATPLAGALQVARAHGLVPRLLDLRNSGDTAGDRSRVVGYCAIAFDAALPADAARNGSTGAHDAALGAALLSRARNALAVALALPTRPEPDHPALTEAGATFVTLRCRGELRGCIGRLEATRPLADDVRHNALAAAFEDPRFEPLHANELAELEIEVSLLGAAQPWPARSEGEALRTVQPGVDGVILEWRGRQATFLPQVWEQLPDPADFMAALKRKAGLAADFWASDIRLSRYRVRKFEEVAS